MTESEIEHDGVIYKRDVGERDVPISVLWTTLPVISAIIPVIGHVGITDSNGLSFDFSGPYQVTVGSLMCGPAKRIWTLDTERIGAKQHINTSSIDELYDHAVSDSARLFAKQMHNIVTNNCHHHIASVLNELQYDGKTNWTQMKVFWNIWRHGRWVSSSACLSAFTPTIIIFIFASGLAFYLIFRNR